ncbi:hypothetical protein [Vibrio sp. M260112]|uniref:hypothetical protein n=1 Tax=Vibrio sp. M260112 TaxID=3020895 RepID=UPI002F4185B5
MKLEVTEIKNCGTLNQEYVKISVTSDCNLSYYLLTDTTYTSSDTISNKLRHVYWFRNKEVKKGDTIYLYSCKGSDSSNSGTHKFYWNLGKSVWNNDGDAAVLFKISTWKTTKA